jgi:heme exporter protein A
MVIGVMTKRIEFFSGVSHHASHAVEAQALGCSRGLRPVFKGLDFCVKSGMALALYGANGSGKTSLLRLLAGFLQPCAGTLSRPPQRHYLGHADGLKAAMRLDETLVFETALQGGQIIAPRDLLAHLGLAGRDAQLVGDLSAGQRRRLSLARLLIAPRPLWLLDEPFTALDAQGVALVDALARAHLACGGMIVAASHIELGFATQTLDLDEASAATPTQKEAD